MDLLSPNSELDLNDPTWKIYTEDATSLPQYICDTAVINTAFITQGCVVEGEITNSVLFTGVIGTNARVGSKDSEHIELVSKRVKGAE